MRFELGLFQYLRYSHCFSVVCIKLLYFHSTQKMHSVSTLQAMVFFNLIALEDVIFYVQMAKLCQVYYL